MNIKQIHRAIYDLKHPGRGNALKRLPVYVDDRLCAFLRPVTGELDANTSNDSRLISAWRNQSRDAFFTWIGFTEELTTRWLQNVYRKNSDDILFMIESKAGEPYGHIALYNFDEDSESCEFGRVIRGAANSIPGMMAWSCETLFEWAFNALCVRTIVLEVFESNGKAISLYRDCGFTATQKIALQKHTKNNTIVWTKNLEHETEETTRFALRMELTKASKGR